MVPKISLAKDRPLAFDFKVFYDDGVLHEMESLAVTVSRSDPNAG